MAKLGYAHDTASIPASDPFEILPAGNYPVMIVASEMKATKSGTGDYLELKMQVIDGQYKGRYVWDRLNVRNVSEKAQDIAQKKFSAICLAVGVTFTDDSEDVHGKPMIAVLKVQPEGPDHNGTHRQAQQEVSGYKPMSSEGGGAPLQQGGTAPMPQRAVPAGVQQRLATTTSTTTPAARPAPAQPAWRSAPKA